MSENLQPAVDRVLQLAQKQGYVVPADVREVLRDLELSEDLWSDVIAETKSSLRHPSDRYYYQGSASGSAPTHKQKQTAVERGVAELIQECRDEEHRNERRDRGRVVLIQPAVVRGEDGRELNLLTRDVSPTGIRLIGTHRLLGQKVEVCISAPMILGSTEPVQSWTFLVRILWTCEVGDQLFENGGSLLEVYANETESA